VGEEASARGGRRGARHTRPVLTREQVHTPEVFAAMAADPLNFRAPEGESQQVTA
jgi:hypothetical protein